jgi:hypothetical protein
MSFLKAEGESKIPISLNSISKTEICQVCEKEFVNRERFVDHLFSNSECMRGYWKEEERYHSYSFRRNLSILRQVGRN